MMLPKKILQTLCIIRREDRILLGMKKRGFGKGKWNGFGGKVMPGETVEEAARRELKEEAGIDAGSISEIGVLEFEFADSPKMPEVHVFKVHDFSGKITETEEMRPRWFDISDIPFGEMWPDDEYWLPLFLKNKKFRGSFKFGISGKLEKKELVSVD